MLTVAHGPAANAMRYVLIGSVSANSWSCTRSVSGVARDAPDRSRAPPVGGARERERDARLEIRLVEAREELIRVGRDEQRVEVVGAVGRVAVADDARARGGDPRDERRWSATFSPTTIALRGHA